MAKALSWVRGAHLPISSRSTGFENRMASDFGPHVNNGADPGDGPCESCGRAVDVNHVAAPYGSSWRVSNINGPAFTRDQAHADPGFHGSEINGFGAEPSPL